MERSHSISVSQQPLSPPSPAEPPPVTRRVRNLQGQVMRRAVDAALAAHQNGPAPVDAQGRDTRSLADIWYSLQPIETLSLLAGEQIQRNLTLLDPLHHQMQTELVRSYFQENKEEGK